MLLYKEEMRKKEEVEKQIKDNPMLSNIDIATITAAGGAVNIIQCTRCIEFKANFEELEAKVI